MNIDELRDRLAAISMAIANQDDREAQAIIRTTLEALAEQADDKADAERLDALDRLCESYGFQDIHEGNRWTIEGPFRNVREAIDATRSTP